MNKYLKISALSFVFVASMFVTNTIKATECGVCKLNAGSCTIDLRPGQGDGTLCACKGGATCGPAGEGCACKEAPKQEAVPENVGGDVVAPVETSGEVVDNNVNPTQEMPVVTAGDELPTQSNSSVTLILIVVGVVVVIAGAFGLVKFMGSKK